MTAGIFFLMKGAGYFFCMNCPRVETVLFLKEKVACPLFMFTRGNSLRHRRKSRAFRIL